MELYLISITSMKITTLNVVVKWAQNVDFVKIFLMHAEHASSTLSLFPLLQSLTFKIFYYYTWNARQIVLKL